MLNKHINFQILGFEADFRCCPERNHQLRWLYKDIPRIPCPEQRAGTLWSHRWGGSKTQNCCAEILSGNLNRYALFITFSLPL